MTDFHDIVVFSSEGEKILGIVVEHYTNPLDDFYVIYSDYALHKSHNPNEDASIIIDNVIIPACDAALADYRLKRQHLKDMDTFHKETFHILDNEPERLLEISGIGKKRKDMKSHRSSRPSSRCTRMKPSSGDASRMHCGI